MNKGFELFPTGAPQNNRGEFSVQYINARGGLNWSATSEIRQFGWFTLVNCLSHGTRNTKKSGD